MDVRRLVGKNFECSLVLLLCTQINEAYKILNNPSTRKSYDLKLQQSSTPLTSAYNQTSGNPFGSVPSHR